MTELEKYTCELSTWDRLGEFAIPEEFLCPISCEIMQDPVKLPTSGTTMERSVITRILLSDSKDPFNREKLEIKDLREDVEMKIKIYDWVESKIGVRPEEK